jgi:ComF family protein
MAHLDGCVSAVAYAGDVTEWLQRFKYPPPGLAGLDAAPIAIVRELVADAAHLAPGPCPDWVVPVPLHSQRLRSRGFNPAALLARRVAEEVGARCAPMALRRVRDTPSQTGLDRRARRRNVAGAFECKHEMPGTVWLVDDVATTGATLSECARVLRRRGARRVVAICVARTPRVEAENPDS